MAEVITKVTIEEISVENLRGTLTDLNLNVNYVESLGMRYLIVSIGLMKISFL